MSDFTNGFCFGYAMTRRPFGSLSLYGNGLYNGFYSNAFARESVIGSPLVFSCYADLDSPSGLSSAIPFVNYAVNSPYTGSYNPFSFGFGGFGYFC